jgi:hypothetical protein
LEMPCIRRTYSAMDEPPGDPAGTRRRGRWTDGYFFMNCL